MTTYRVSGVRRGVIFTRRYAGSVPHVRKLAKRFRERWQAESIIVETSFDATRNRGRRHTWIKLEEQTC